MEAFLKVMKALSDTNRVKIVKMLQQKSLCVCEIRGALDIAQPTVSKHLKILEDSGMVHHVKEGLWVNYHLADGSANPYAATLMGNLRHWLNENEEVRQLMERLPFLDREALCRK